MPGQHPDLHPLYAQHLMTLQRNATAALERAGCDHLVIAAGQPAMQFLDDRPYPFAVNPHFKHWLPVTNAPGSWLVHTPGERPRLIYLQPRDYWHVVPEAPAGYWVEHFDITIIREPAEARAHLPADATRCAVIGEANAAIDGFVPDNPRAVLDHLHWHRAYKTEYELAMMRVASRIGVRAHRAAEYAFRSGASEFDIHMAYLAAARQTDNELPYGNIIALNEHGAILHYTDLAHAPPAISHSFLIDAGASFHGYASDITRTHAARGVHRASAFQSLVDAVDEAQQRLAAGVVAGQSYPELHLRAHLALAAILREHGFIRCTPESALESGISRAFFPHGLGHPIGLQVHDVAGFQASEAGGTIPRPAGHPYLRMTRTLEPGMVVTIEPGIYFIDMLLAELRATAAGADVDWGQVEEFRRFGGIRIEDDVVCTDGAPENLTRDAFSQLA